MFIGSTSTAGHLALNRGINRMEQAAEQIAKASMSPEVEGKPTDLIKPIVELHEADLESQAAIKLLSAEKDAVGTLLDVVA
jgi:hypothetical protein